MAKTLYTTTTGESLTYREVQKLCKLHKLGAKGKGVDLISKLNNFLSSNGTTTTTVNASIPTVDKTNVPQLSDNWHIDPAKLAHRDNVVPMKTKSKPTTDLEKLEDCKKQIDILKAKYSDKPKVVEMKNNYHYTEKVFNESCEISWKSINEDAIEIETSNKGQLKSIRKQLVKLLNDDVTRSQIGAELDPSKSDIYTKQLDDIKAARQKLINDIDCLLTEETVDLEIEKYKEFAELVETSEYNEVLRKALVAQRVSTTKELECEYTNLIEKLDSKYVDYKALYEEQLEINEKLEKENLELTTEVEHLKETVALKEDYINELQETVDSYCDTTTESIEKEEKTKKPMYPVFILDNQIAEDLNLKQEDNEWEEMEEEEELWEELMELAREFNNYIPLPSVEEKFEEDYIDSLLDEGYVDIVDQHLTIGVY